MDRSHTAHVNFKFLTAITIKGYEVGNNIHNSWHMFMAEANQNIGTSPGHQSHRGTSPSCEVTLYKNSGQHSFVSVYKQRIPASLARKLNVS